MRHTLRDAELRVRFAEAYVTEVMQEYQRSPADWKDMLAEAQYCLEMAHASHQKLLAQSNGQTRTAVG